MRKKISTIASFSVAILQERSHKVTPGDVRFFQYVSKRSICIFYIYVQDVSRKLPKTILLAYTDVQLYYVICLEMGTNFDGTLFVDPKKHLILVYWPCTGLQSMPHSSFCRLKRKGTGKSGNLNWLQWRFVRFTTEEDLPPFWPEHVFI